MTAWIADALIMLGLIVMTLGVYGIVRFLDVTSASSLSWVQLACSAALAASLVPSSASVPTRTMPAAAHSRSDSTRKPARACSWRTRKRAMVTWSGDWVAARAGGGRRAGRCRP